jgi:large subunit ribosomal protein L4
MVMELQVINSATGAPQQMLALESPMFSREFNEPLIHQVVNAYLAALRQGSKAQKTRSQVRGGGKKPWRQKGTGRARAGTIRSPLWRGGGKTFAAVPRDYTQKVNKKMYRAAMQSILAELIRQNRLVLVDHVELPEIKTKGLIAKLQALSLPEKSVLFVTDGNDDNLYLSARNLPEVEVITVDCVDPVSLIRFEKVVMTLPALKFLEESVQ